MQCSAVSYYYWHYLYTAMLCNSTSLVQLYAALVSDVRGLARGSPLNHRWLYVLYVRIAFLIRGCSNASKYYFNCFGCWSVQRADRLQDEICPLQPKYKDVIFGLNFKEDCVVAPLLLCPQA